MVTERETALAILNEAKSAGFEDKPIPDSDDELIARAQHFYEEAKKLWDNNDALLKDKDVKSVVQSIVWMGDSPLISVTPPSVEERTEEPEPKVQEKSEISEPLSVQENLPIPHHIEGDPEAMPRDLSKLNDREVRRLSGEYNAYLGRVTYLLGVESSDLASSEHLLEAERARALRELPLVDPNGDGKKQKLAKVIDAEILADPRVTELTAAVAKHQQQVIVLKSLKEIYSSNVERLSREWTMRQNEWEKSR